MLVLRYLTKNKKRTFITISSITLVTILFLCIGLLFSSIRNYMINDIKKTTGDYHISMQTKDIKNSHIIKKTTNQNITYITYDNIKNTYKYTKQICKKQTCKNIKYNENLLSLYGVSQKTNTLNMLKNIIIIILTILSLGIIIIIYNSFSITIIERRKQFSLLKSVGMTQTKIKNMVLLEAIISLIIGLIIGFITSVNVMFIFLKILNTLLKELFTSKLILTFYPSFVIIPLIFVIIIVLISAYLPASKAAKTSIISSIQNQTDFKYKKEPKIIKKIKITKRLAYHNYKRCKKKYRPIILCIFINVIIYTTISLYLNYGIKSINNYSNIPNYDAEITIKESQNINNKTLETYAKNNSKQYNIFQTCTTQTNKKQAIIISGNDNYVINRIKQIDTKNNKMYKIDKTYLKDKITLTIKGEKQTIKTKNTIPLGTEQYLTKENIVIVTTDIKKYCTTYNTKIILKENKDLKTTLTKLSKNTGITNIEYIDIKKATKITNNIITSIKIILYSLTILIMLIAISTIINTISTSINLRTKEFACLKSIGLTKKQKHEILLTESIYITIKGLIIALPFVYLINYLLHESLKKVFDMNIIMPHKEIIVIATALLIIIYLTMLKAHKQINDNKIIKKLTNENI